MNPPFHRVPAGWVPMLLSLCVSLSVVGSVRASDPASLRLVPFPKEVRLTDGAFAFGPRLVLEVTAPHGDGLAEPLNAELRRGGLRRLPVRTLAAPGPAFRITAQPGTPFVGPALPTVATGTPEAYGLAVRSGDIVGAAAEPAGLHAAAQTLRQLIRANRSGTQLPTVEIRDWPSLRWRGFQDDLTRGPSSTLATLTFEADLGSYLKLNLMTYYMEYQYAFRKHPRIGPPDGSLTPEDLSALVEYARPLHLDILGNQQSFGHFGRILRHPEYAHLRETEDVLTPVREETYQLLDDLYSEVCPRVPFPWFNVCCDETWGLGTGPSREQAAQIGVGGVYVQHIRRVHELLRTRHGKRMMMWGDIILQHPDRLRDIPADMLMLTWGYDARPSFEDQIVPFVQSGFAFLVCPGVNNWSRILPDFGVAITNIQHFVRDGVKHGTLGMLNTDWEDDGEALNAVKWHADAWAAECAWNGASTSLEAFQQRVGAVLFGEAGDHFGQAITALTPTHRQPAMRGLFNARFWEDDFSPRGSPAAIEAAAGALLAAVRPAIAHLEACQREARWNQAILEVYLFGARRLERMGQRMLDGLQAAQAYERACTHLSPASPTPRPARTARAAARRELAEVERLVRANRDAHAALGREFARLWLSESKPYALDWTLTRYTNTLQRFDALLARVQQARAAAQAGRPLPAPEVIGLALPRPLSRRIHPTETAATLLETGRPWQDATATHRLGLVVDAGTTDRWELPVELELTLPATLIGRPVRAFLARDDGPEIPAQLDALDRAGRGRLVLVVPGPLPKGSQLGMHVYLGVTSSAPPLPSAARVPSENPDNLGLENDQVRLQIGTEGAHVYRWEVKAADGHDLTMPGAQGWAGFSDQAQYRHTPHTLRCTARGPAMVEVRCTEAGGHGKTLRLYAGASWLEVFLDEPTPIYWDFDAPANFAADGPSPGRYLFSNGQGGEVGREADGVPAQVEAAGTVWSLKYREKLALGLITPGTPALHHVAPGAGAGGVGIEHSPPVRHLATWAGVPTSPPAETLTRLEQTLDLKRPVSVRVHGLQERAPTAALPAIEPWRRVALDPEYAGAWVVAGDLDRDGEVEIVTARNVDRNDVHFTSAVAAHALDGTVRWRWGDPRIGRRKLHHDVACQIHDWDGDGRPEVVLATENALVELDGTTGQERRRLPLPPAASDCLVFANLSGGPHPSEVLVKDRYTQIWALHQDGHVLWTVTSPGGYPTAHQPVPIDLDGDGRDEIMSGYALLNADGTVRWVYRSPTIELARGHLDCGRVLRRGATPEAFRLALTFCGANALAVCDGLGRPVWETTGSHFESIDIGRFGDGQATEPRIVVDIDHLPRGESRLRVYDAAGVLHSEIQTDYARHHALVDWTGDGRDEIVVADDRTLYDSAGRSLGVLAMRAEDLGHGTDPQAAEMEVLVGDYTGDRVPDVMLTTRDSRVVYVYRNAKGARVPGPLARGTEPNFTLY